MIVSNVWAELNGMTVGVNYRICNTGSSAIKIAFQNEAPDSSTEFLALNAGDELPIKKTSEKIWAFAQTATQLHVVNVPDASTTVTFQPGTSLTPDITATGVISVQNLNPEGIATVLSAVEIECNSKGSITAQLNGIYTGAISLQLTTDGINWITKTTGTSLVRTSDGVPSDSIYSGSNGIWQADVSGYLKARLTALGVVSGSAAVTIIASAQSSQINATVISRKPSDDLRMSAFGEQMTAQRTPVVQTTFAENIIRSLQWDQLTFNGSITAENHMAVLQTSAAANSHAILTSKVPVKYNAGQGGETAFTAILSPPAAGSYQEIGIGDLQSGIFIGYSGVTFGHIRRCPAGNRAAITSITRVGQIATITTSAPHGKSTGDIIEITGNASTPNNENDYIGGFILTSTGANTFTITLTVPASAAITPAAGVFKWDSVIDNMTAINVWSEDAQDGTGKSGQLLVQTLGNVYAIRFQYLGFGAIYLDVETKNTGSLDNANIIQYANSNEKPSLGNPTLPLYAAVRNTSNATNITLKTASMAGFVQGYNAELSLYPFSSANSVSGITSTELPILSIQNKRAFNGEINKTRIKFKTLSLYSDGTGSNPITFRVLRNATLTGSNFIDKDASNSVCAISKTATAVSGGSEVFAVTTARLDNAMFNEMELDLYLNVGDIYTVVSSTSSSSFAAYVSFSWRELI